MLVKVKNASGRIGIFLIGISQSATAIISHYWLVETAKFGHQKILTPLATQLY